MSKFLKWIVNIVLLLAIVVACGLLIPPLTGVNTVIIDDVEMSTNLDRGSVTYGTPKSLNELAVGDDIIIQEANAAYVYRLKEIDASSGNCELEDIKSTDSQTHSETFTKEIPKVLFTVPYIGYVTMAMKSTEGLIIIGLAVIFIIILFILSELWKKDKYEEDEEDEETEKDEQNEKDEKPTPVDMSAHILEKVSSEIGSEISNAIAKDTDENGEAVTITVADEETRDTTMDMVKELEKVVGAVAESDDVKKEAEDKEQDETKDKAKDADIKEALEDKVEDIKEALADGDDSAIGEVADEAAEALGEDLSEKELEEDLEPVEMAMPTCTAEELIQEAKEAGYEPEVNKDEDLGITILDYSKIL